MRPFWNSLGDPGLHLLAIAIILACLGLNPGSGSEDFTPATPQSSCEGCHAHVTPGESCGLATRAAHLAP